MKEIRFHGRGGQGTVMAAEILTTAFILDGKFSAGFPMFGFERRGAPVTAFVRFDEKPVREKTIIYRPDCLVVTDRPSLNSPLNYSGLKDGGILIANISEKLDIHFNAKLSLLGAIDATTIALQEIGFPAVNTAILGAFAAATEWVNLDSILEAIGKYFVGELLDKNNVSAKRGFKEVKTILFQK